MRAAITAVLPEPAPATTWTGPSGAVIAASCSGVGFWPRSAARTPGVTAPVRVVLTVHLHRCRRPPGAPGRPRRPGRPRGAARGRDRPGEGSARRWGPGRPGGGGGARAPPGGPGRVPVFVPERRGWRRGVLPPGGVARGGPGRVGRAP